MCSAQPLCVLAALLLSACTSSTEVLGPPDAGGMDAGSSHEAAPPDASSDVVHGDVPGDAQWEDANFPPAPPPDGGTGAADAGPDAGGECNAMAPWPPDGPSGSGSLEWSVSLRGPSNETLSDVAADAEGNVYVVGYYGGAATLGDESLPEASSGLYSKGIVASFTAEGALRWMRVLEGTGFVHAERVHVTADDRVLVAGTGNHSLDVGGGSLTGDLNADIFVAEYASEDGAHRGSRLVGGPNNDRVRYLGVDATGGIVLTGEVSGGSDDGGAVDLGGGARERPGDNVRFGFVAVYEATTLAHRFDHVLDAYIHGSVIADAIYLAGRFDTELHIDGRRLRASDPREHFYDGFVLELGSEGTLVRAREYGSFSSIVSFGPVLAGRDCLAIRVGLEDGADVGTGPVEACDTATGLLLVGSDLESRELRIYADARYWDLEMLVGEHRGFPFAFGELGRTDPVRLGDEHYRGRNDRDLDAFVAELLPDGRVGWMRRWGDAGWDTARKAVAPDDTHFLVVGASKTSVDLGGGTITNLGRQDAHLMKIAR